MIRYGTFVISHDPDYRCLKEITEKFTFDLDSSSELESDFAVNELISSIFLEIKIKNLVLRRRI